MSLFLLHFKISRGRYFKLSFWKEEVKFLNQTQMPVFMFVGSCSIVISGLLLVNGTKNRPFDCRIGSILIKKIPPSTVCF